MAVVLGASPAAVYGDVNNTATLTTASFTPAVGSVVVAKVFAADGGTIVGTPTATGLTFTSRANLGTANTSTRVALFTAIGAGSAVTVAASFSGIGNFRGLSVEVWTGAQLAASPAVASVDGVTGAPSFTINTTAANSVVTWANDDWTATDGASRSYRSSATETAYHFSSGHTSYGAYQQAATAGTQTFGLSLPTGQKYTMAGIEIQPSGAAVATRFRTIGKRR